MKKSLLYTILSIVGLLIAACGVIINNFTKIYWLGFGVLIIGVLVFIFFFVKCIKKQREENKTTPSPSPATVVALILKHKIQASRFEANNGGEGYKEDIERELKKVKYRLNITSRMATTTKKKELRIFDKAPEIREFYFLENGKRSKDYNLFMQNLFSFKVIGKNTNDDAPDSLAMAVEMKNDACGRVEVVPRPF